MTDAVTCPHCREHLDIPAEYRGRPVRCANCQNVFTPPSDAPPVVHPLPGRPSGRPVPRARPLDDESDDRRPPRRANGPVVLLLLSVLLFVVLPCGGLNLIAYLTYNPEFTPYTSPEGKFKVEFPVPTTAKVTAANPLDDQLQGVKVTGNRQLGNESYLVKSYPLHAAGAKLPPAEALKLLADAEVQALNVGAEIRPREETTHDGFPAVDVMAGGNGLGGQEQAMMRVIVAGNRVYVLAVTGPQTNPQFWWLRKFFVSFEITDPPPKPEKKDGGK